MTARTKAILIIATALTALTAAKLTGIVKLSWLWVLAPVWLPIALFAGIYIAGALIVALNPNQNGE